MVDRQYLWDEMGILDVSIYFGHVLHIGYNILDVSDYLGHVLYFEM